MNLSFIWHPSPWFWEERMQIWWYLFVFSQILTYLIYEKCPAHSKLVTNINYCPLGYCGAAVSWCHSLLFSGLGDMTLQIQVQIQVQMQIQMCKYIKHMDMHYINMYKYNLSLKSHIHLYTHIQRLHFIVTQFFRKSYYCSHILQQNSNHALGFWFFSLLWFFLLSILWIS